MFREVKDSAWSAEHVDDHGEAFVVTARDMTPAEKKTFHRKAR